ncbi:hypothetical protein ACIQNJ_29190 [Streptomyces sp. NPDC091283]|uniref:hypothetical protein n=1 Tax=Streptomyces sp. NPDC091283 TaxID=3365987 RepID=UPI0038049128
MKFSESHLTEPKSVTLPFRELGHLPDHRVPFLRTQVQYSPLLHPASYMGAVSIVGGVEQQQVQGLRNRARREFLEEFPEDLGLSNEWCNSGS